MKVRIDKKDLLRACNRASAAANTNGVMAAAVLDATEDGLAVTGCDYAMAVRTRVDCRVEAVGVAMVPAQKLARMVAAMPDGHVDLTLAANGAGLHLEVGRVAFYLEGWPASDAPRPFEDLDNASGPRDLLTNAASVIRAMRVAVEYVGTDSNRPAICNVLVANGPKGNVRAVATDGTRAAICPTACTDPGVRWAIPPAAVAVLGEFGDVDEALIVKSPRHLTWIVGNVDVQIRMDAEALLYPDVDRVWSDTDGVPVVVNAAEWRNTMRRAMLATDATKRVKVAVDPFAVTVSADGGTAYRDHLDPVGRTTCRAAIGINAAFALQAAATLAEWGGESVRMRVTGPKDAVYFEDPDHVDFPRVVIMPMALD